MGGGPMAPQESGGCFAALRYSCKNPSLQSETVHYKRGVSQQFSLPSFKIDFSEWKDDEVTLGNSSGAQTYLQVKHPRTYNVKIKKTSSVLWLPLVVGMFPLPLSLSWATQRELCKNGNAMERGEDRTTATGSVWFCAEFTQPSCLLPGCGV